MAVTNELIHGEANPSLLAIRLGFNARVSKQGETPPDYVLSCSNAVALSRTCLKSRGGGEAAASPAGGQGRRPRDASLMKMSGVGMEGGSCCCLLSRANNFNRGDDDGPRTA